MRRNIYVFLPFFFLFIFLVGFFSFIEWDENTYLSNARIDSNYREDFRFPLLSFFLRIIFSLTGESLLVAKLFMSLVTTLSVFIFFLLTGRYAPRHRDLATFLFALHPLTLLWGPRVYADFLGLLFILLSLYFFRDSLSSYLLSGFFASLAFLSRFNLALWAFALFVVLLFRARSLHEKNFFLTFCIGVSLPLVPWLLYNHFVHGSMLWNLVQQYQVVGSSQIPRPFYLQLINLAVYFNVFLLLFLSNLKRLPSQIAVFVSVSFVHIVFFVAAKDPRYWLPLLPFAIMFSFSSRQKKTVVAAAVILTVLLSAYMLHANLSKCHSSVDRSIDFVSANTAAQDVVVSNFWPYFGYSLDREVHSMYGSKEVLRHRYVPKFFVYHDSIGDPYDLQSLQTWDRLENVANFSDCEGTAYVFKVLY